MSWRNSFSSCVAMPCCCSGLSVTFHLASSGVAFGSNVCDQLPVEDESFPDGSTEFCPRFALKYPYGDACDAVCQSSVGLLVANAFGNHEFQSGSSLTFESIPIPCRFLVMIWFEATQSDQPEITWMSRLTALPFGSSNVLPLYVKPASVSVFFASVGL